MSEYTGISIPNAIVKEVQEIMGTLGYRSLTEFVVEATRVYLKQRRWDYERKKAEEEEVIVKKHAEGEESIEHQFDK